MHKKKASSTKIYVRNPERPKPKTTFVNHYDVRQQEEDKKKENVSKKSVTHNRESRIRFKSPEPNSALILARQIESLENLKPRKVKSVSSLSVEKLAVDEKVTKHMNFPLDQPIYRNLIPLCTKPPSQPFLAPSRPPLPNKDEEPSLSDFYTPKENSEYSYQPSVASRQISVVKDADCLKLYAIMQSWNNV